MNDRNSGNVDVVRKSMFVIALAVIVASSFFIAGLVIGANNSKSVLSSPLFAGSSLPPENVDFTPVWKAWNAINEKYVSASTTDMVTDQEKVWGMVEGLANSLGDPYTVFFPPADAEIFAEDISGNFEGVGMEIGVRDGIITVIAPLRGTPADRAGIVAGDQILRIDNVSTDNMTVDEAVKLIRGEGGTPVVFLIAREGESEFLEIEVIRDVIDIPTIQGTLRPDGVYVIELFNFSAVSTNLFRAELRTFVESGGDKLILDLRGNPGGFLEAAVDMASWFLPAGKVVVEEDFGESDKPRVHRSKGYNIFNDNLNMVVLINQGSASASEILAGALQQHGVAVLIGERSFGKGSVQELVDITSDTSLKVTIARWLTPDGTSISDGGLTPDIVVPLTIEEFQAGEDPQLERAVQELLN